MRALATVLVAIAILLALVFWLARGRDADVVPLASTTEAAAHDGPDARPEALSAPSDRETAARSDGPVATSTRADGSSGQRCRIFGRVIDETGAPLADVSLTISAVGARWSETELLMPSRTPEGTQERLSTTTAADGKFAFDTPVPTADSIGLSVVPDLYHALADRSFGSFDGHVRPGLVAGDNDLGDIVVLTCGAIEGRVVSVDGRPIEHVNASVGGTNAAGRSVQGTTDATGCYRIGHLPAGKREMFVYARRWITKESIPIQVESRTTTQVADVVLAPALAIEGIVVDESGKGLPGIPLQAQSPDGRQSLGGRTLADGTFTIFVDQTGAHIITVHDAPGFLPWGGGPDAAFEPGAKDIRIQLARAPSMTFRVVDAHTREPIERFGIRFVAQSRTALLGDDALELEDHPRGEVTLPFPGRPSTVIVSAAEHADVEIDVDADAASKGALTIALPRPSGLHGRIHLGGKPVAGATVVIEREAIDPDRKFRAPPQSVGGGIRHDLGSFAGRRRVRQSDADGSFVAFGIAAGTYAIRIEASGAAERWLRGVSVPLEDVVPLGTIELQQGSVVRGVLVAGADQSPVGFQLGLRGGTDYRRITVDNIDGKFEFSGLEAREYALVWGRPRQSGFTSGDPREQTIALSAGEVREVLIDASGSTPCTVIVHVTRNGRPAAGVRLSTRVRHPTRAGSEETNLLGTSDEGGTVEGQVDGDKRFDILVSGGGWSTVAEVAVGLDANPGGRIERDFQMSTGRIVVELPASLAVPVEGNLRLRLERGGFEVRIIDAAASPSSFHDGPVWRGNRIEMGEVLAGEYDATLTVHGIEIDENRTPRRKFIELREPYRTKVVVEEDREAKIVIP